MAQVIPNAVALPTESHTLFVPTAYFQAPGEVLFSYLVQAWVYTAWLTRKFPDSDREDVAMIAGMCTCVPIEKLLTALPEMEAKFPDHPKKEVNRAMIETIAKDFHTHATHGPEVVAEVMALMERATEEVDNALFPCVCGECDKPQRN